MIHWNPACNVLEATLGYGTVAIGGMIATRGVDRKPAGVVILNTLKEPHPIASNVLNEETQPGGFYISAVTDAPLAILAAAVHHVRIGLAKAKMIQGLVAANL